jgi:hypothetical protein
MLTNLSLVLAFAGSLLFNSANVTVDEKAHKALFKPNTDISVYYTRSHKDFHLYKNYLICRSGIPLDLGGTPPEDGCDCES